MWGAFILLMTSIPGSDLPSVGVPYADKLVHLGLYAVLGALSALAMGAAARRGRVVVLTLGLIALFAAVDEWHQRFIPGRSTDAIDWIADVAGATTGFLLLAARAPRPETIT